MHIGICPLLFSSHLLWILEAIPNLGVFYVGTSGGQKQMRITQE
jgi:hypothetical protein